MEQNLNCRLPNHASKPLTMVCSNLECKTKRRLMCLKCLLENHKDCVNHVLEIENIFTRDLALNLNWFKNEEIKTAVKLIKKYDLNNQVQVLETSEKRVEEEFAKLKDHLNEEIDKAKEIVLNNLRERQSNDVQFNLKTFTKRMEEFYGFDTLVGIIESTKNNNQNDLETLNIVLESFFTSLNDKKNGSDADLETKSKSLGKYLKDVIELDTSLFEKAKTTFRMKSFENYLEKPNWTWNPDFKSEGITLSKNNMFAKKTQGSGYVAIGTFEMSKGVHKWELDIASANNDSYWIAFGIVDKAVLVARNNTHHIGSFNYTRTYGFSIQGCAYQMSCVKIPKSFDNKTYVCDLDMDKGTFTISCDGHLFLQVGVDANKNGKSLSKAQRSPLLGKTVVPYVFLWTPGDRATLRVL